MADYDRYKLQNPVTQYSKDGFPKQQQNPPGLQTDMTPVPDCGEKSYRGSGRLGGRKALVAGKQTAVKDIADLTTEQFRETFETNVKPTYFLYSG